MMKEREKEKRGREEKERRGRGSRDERERRGKEEGEEREKSQGVGVGERVRCLVAIDEAVRNRVGIFPLRTPEVSFGK
jgi:hypothetical protein